MTDIPAPVTFADLEAATGFGPRTVRRLVRECKLPGRIIGRRLLLTRGEFQQFLDGTWTPTTAPTPIRSSDFHKRRSA